MSCSSCGPHWPTRYLLRDEVPLCAACWPPIRFGHLDGPCLTCSHNFASIRRRHSDSGADGLRSARLGPGTVKKRVQGADGHGICPLTAPLFPKRMCSPYFERKPIVVLLPLAATGQGRESS
jgi:hypothetical protein